MRCQGYSYKTNKHFAVSIFLTFIIYISKSHSKLQLNVYYGSQFNLLIKNYTRFNAPF
ncbi:hypothetical protein SANA_14190 [Gottschalkiaceae bacterium SANA]|nr:hypothetical protein SANA_14190 [Gottschalkiaceae bacterium SANA]